MKTKLLIASALIFALTGCEETEPDCFIKFANGSFVYDKLTDEKYVVTQAHPFTNIHTGRCSIMVRRSDGLYSPMSSFAVRSAG